MRNLLRWLGQKTSLYLLLLTLIILSSVSTPIIYEAVTANKRAPILAHANNEIAKQKTELTLQFQTEAAKIRQSSATELSAQKTKLTERQSLLEKSIASAKPPWVLALANPENLLMVERQKLQLAWVRQQLEAVVAAQTLMKTRDDSLKATYFLPAQQSLVKTHGIACNNAVQKLKAYENRWNWKIRQWIDNSEHQKLVKTQKMHCEAYNGALKVLKYMQQAQRYREQAQKAGEAAYDNMTSNAAYLRTAGGDLAADMARAKAILSDTLPQKIGAWSERIGLQAMLWQAAILLGLIIATPYVVRLLSYYIIAPLALGPAAIRLSIGASKPVSVHHAQKSDVSLSIILKIDEELLIRQDFLQSSSQNSLKSTRWLLDQRHPFTSMAAGLSFLTRITGEGEVTTLSAVQDGFLELTKLRLPDGAAFVLQPRALAAVIQPQNQALRITSHWRIFSLSAWLTMQLRYLVFHGPAELVLTGRRGVRIEHASEGRIFGQDQLIGFSTDLAYNVARTETFWPYFLGSEALLKDRVLAGQGVLIVEEAPQSSHHSKKPAGLEGVVDAVMKIFGV